MSIARTISNDKQSPVSSNSHDGVGRIPELIGDCRLQRLFGITLPLQFPSPSTSHEIGRNPFANFGGLREKVLERDGYHCRVCDASGRDKRALTVHHRVPGKSLLHLMISLCPACHNKVHRTKAVVSAMPPLLLELWREQHPAGHEQTALDFTLKQTCAQVVPLFADMQEASE